MENCMWIEISQEGVTDGHFEVDDLIEPAKYG